MGYVLALAAEILQQTEGTELYQDVIDGLNAIYDLAEKSAQSAGAEAQKFADAYKDDQLIYLMGSGASAKVAYSTSMFLFSEMQWIDSAAYNTGEYFHGPFELTEDGKPYLLFMSEGATRPMDARALTFMQRFNSKVTVIDSKDYGLAGAVSSKVLGYFNPFIHTAVMRVYAEKIAEARKHPLTMRRYMWKIEY